MLKMRSQLSKLIISIDGRLEPVFAVKHWQGKEKGVML